MTGGGSTKHPTAVSFGREICGDLAVAERREWLVTNGLGGYGSGTVAGTLTRRYHGLLIAALPPPQGRVLLLAKLDETATYRARTYPLFSNCWSDGEAEPAGYRYVERFRLEGTTPVWTFAVGDALLEKRIWMEPGANTTYVRYDLVRGSEPVGLSVKAIVNHRDHHGNTRAGAWQPPIDVAPDGLRIGEGFSLRAAGAQLTWMDAKVGDWVVTPRTGKAVEVNALWYNALRIVADIARRLGEPAVEYTELADRAQAGFGRFWNDSLGYCFDVVDGPDGDDARLRPNQLLAVSLQHSPLDPTRQRAVVDVCARHLLTSHGLRSLAPDDPAYVGHYGGDQRRRDGAYHQGTVWAWLIGPFVDAHLRVYGDRAAARSFLAPLIQALDAHGVGTISEIFDGDAPFMPRGAIAQAWSVAEVLRVWRATAKSE